MIVIPVERLNDDFCQRKTRAGGEVLQKFVTDRKRVAILRNISTHFSTSAALRDSVREYNAGLQIWCVANLDELA